MRIGKYIVLILICCLAGAAYAEDHPVLIISSYNPDTKTTSQNISQFMEEYNRLKGKSAVVLENMNCKSFPESYLWKEKMRTILAKYSGKQTPSVIVIFGQEAWSSYLSLTHDVEGSPQIPVVCGMISKNAIFLPDDSLSVRTWEPVSVDMQHFIEEGYRVSGIATNYDIEQNIRLIKDFYPDTKHIAFVSDNSYGGVSLQALVKEEIKKFPELDLILLDGRRNDIYAIVDQIRDLPSETVILLGTWRVDVNDGYYMGNATYSMMSAKPSIPAFTVTSIGLGHWAIGGYIPKYGPIGQEMARQTVDLLNNKQLKAGEKTQFIGNEYVFDRKKLDSSGFAAKKLPHDSVFVNDTSPILEKYKNEIILAIIVLLLVFLMTLLYHYDQMKKMKDILQDLQKDNTIILNNIQLSIKFVNPDFSVKWSNQVSYPCKPTYGRDNCCMVENPVEPFCDRCPLIDAMQRRQPVHYDYECHPGLYVHVLANPVFDEQDRLLGVIVKKEDVTRAKEAELELRQAKNRAEESDRLKSAFLANMSHEIRTPLNAIVGFSELLSDTEDPDEKRDYTHIIQSNNELLLQLINDILDLAKIEAGTLEFVNTNVDVNKLFSDIEQTFKKKVEPSVELAFTERMSHCVIHSEKNRISQVITNFLTNAIKFTSEGSIHFGYRIQHEDTIYFFVSDTGCGISEEEANRVFDRFVKLNNFAQGTGLGLSICQMIVRRLGGDIGVISKEGEGSTFWFTMPYVPVEVLPVVLPEEKQTVVSEKVKKTLLIAEDDASNFKLYSVVLKEYNLIHAWDGLEAVELYAKHHPDVILMDLKMPNLDGYEATLRIRELSPDVPIIAVTAFAFAEDEQRVMDAGFNYYVSKPIKASEIKRIIEALS